MTPSERARAEALIALTGANGTSTEFVERLCNYRLMGMPWGGALVNAAYDVGMVP